MTAMGLGACLPALKQITTVGLSSICNSEDYATLHVYFFGKINMYILRVFVIFLLLSVAQIQETKSDVMDIYKEYGYKNIPSILINSYPFVHAYLEHLYKETPKSIYLHELLSMIFYSQSIEGQLNDLIILESTLSKSFIDSYTVNWLKRWLVDY